MLLVLAQSAVLVLRLLPSCCLKPAEHAKVRERLLVQVHVRWVLVQVLVRLQLLVRAQVAARAALVLPV